MKKVILSAVLGLSVLTACAPHSDAATSSQAQAPNQQPKNEPAPTRVLYDTVRLNFDPQRTDAYRFIDRELGIACYEINERLSCVPIPQSRLDLLTHPK